MANGKIDSSTLGEKLFRSLPIVYQREDKNQRHALERYLKVLAEGGLSYVADETTGLLDLNDPEKTPYNALMVLFEQYGLSMFYGVPEAYLRKLLPIIGDLYASKGSISSIEYLTGIISDVKSEIILDENFYENYHVYLTLDMTYDKKDKRDFPTENQLMRIINEFIPFFFNVTVSILADYNDLLNLSIADEYSEYIDNYSFLYLGDTTNHLDKLTNFSAYTNERDYEKTAFTSITDYAKDEIIENENVIQVIEYGENL